MTTRQRKALAAVAAGKTYREAAQVAGYKTIETVSRVVNSPTGRDYLKGVGRAVDSGAIYSLSQRIKDLSILARVNLFSDPEFSLECVREIRLLEAASQPCE